MKKKTKKLLEALWVINTAHEKTIHELRIVVHELQVLNSWCAAYAETLDDLDTRVVGLAGILGKWEPLLLRYLGKESTDDKEGTTGQ